MKPVLLVVLFWWIAAAVGRTVLNRAAVSAHLGLLEKICFSSALGLGISAYGVFALGLTGQLSFIPITLWWLCLSVIGWEGMRANCIDLRTANSIARRFIRWKSTLHASAIVMLLFWGLAAGVACYQAPGANAWDALAYHLADPKVFLIHHRILLLPTEHHSNFPFTMEMLFTVGLLYSGYVLANLFHLLTAVLLTLAIIGFCRRFVPSGTGLIASTLFVTTPLVLWEATVAYIDLGLSLYVFLAFYAISLAMKQSEDPGSETVKSDLNSMSLQKLIAFGGVLMGFALGIKYLAILPLVFFAILLMLRRAPWKSIILYGVLALAVGAPWYIKNVIWMRNPVYPFAYSVFQNSRYWSADRAAPYAEEQKSFGSPHELSKPGESLYGLLMTPWNLLTNAKIYTNQANYTFTSLIGGLYAGLLFPWLLLRRRSPIEINLVFVLGLLFLSWFFVSQHIRYLIPFLPFAAILCEFSVVRWMAGVRHSRTNSANNTMRFICFGAIAGQIALLVWAVNVLPVSGAQAREIFTKGLEPTALSLPEALHELFASTQAAGELRRNRVSTYSATEWINRYTDSHAKVVLYEDVFGFYLDRDYLWGNGEHSSYIPYTTFQNGKELTAWFRSKDIRYALINLNNAPSNPHVLLPEDPEAIQMILTEWYSGESAPPGGWRYLVGDAIRNGYWRVVYSHHGVAVLEIGGSNS